MARVAARSHVERALSHHSLKSPEVARRIVAHSGLAPPDTVYEIGPGSGMLTAALAARVRRLVAVEHDRAAWAALRERFAGTPNVEVVLGDFLEHRLPPRGDYRVVGNIPFAQTSAIMRRLLAAPNPPLECILVMQREAALRWSGAVRETEVSVMAKTRFGFDLRLALRRQDFVPRPRVECVVLGVTRKPRPDLAGAEEAAFRAFVRRGFGGGRRSLRANLGGWVRPEAFEAAARATGLPRDAAPGEVAYPQWLDLFVRSRTQASTARRMAATNGRR